MSMRVLLVIVFSTLLYDLSAQDMHFSQATNFPLLLNPAYSGLYNAKSRAIVSMRNQNIAIPNTAFTGVYNTLGASFETKICEEITNQNTWSVGLMALSDYAGSGTLATNQVMVTTGYNVSMDRYGRSFLSLGGQIGMISRRIFTNDLLFESQVKEYAFDPRLPNLEPFLDGRTQIVPSFNLGLIYQQHLSDNATSQLGFSIYNINKPKDFFISNSNANIFSRFNMTGGVLFKLDDVSRIYPSIVHMRQGEFTQTNIGMSYSNDLTDDVSVLAALRTRLGDAYILAAGMRYRKMNIVLSYDITTSSLSSANKSMGALELNVTFLFGEGKEQYGSDKQYCPSF
jgi:type IX secretion system PorP/SprF family membrane protein